jgi:type III secretion protein C
MTPIRFTLHHLRSATLLATAAAFMVATAPAAFAGEPPFPNKLIKVAPRGQAISDTLRDVFGQAGLQVKISSMVKGQVAGNWVGSPKDIWTQLAKSFNLVSYYDGGVVRIYDASEITTRNFQTSSPDSVLANARKLGLTGSGNSIKAGQNSVVASGVPEFLNRVAALAASATPPPVRVATAALPPKDAGPVSSKPSSGDIVSPLNKNPSMIPQGQQQVAQSSLPVTPSFATNPADSYRLAFNTIQAASAREPYEIRVYFLKYGEARDRVVNYGDGEEVVEGIASIIGGMMGNSSRSIRTSSYGNGQATRKTVDTPEPGSYPYGPYGPIPQQQQIVQEPQIVENGSGPRVRPYDDGNAVVVRDLPSRMATYDNLIRTFDRPKTQIEVEITIIDVDTEKSRALGIDWSFGFSALGGLFGGTVDSSNQSSSSANVTAKFVRSSSQFVGAQITALQKNGYLKVVQKPHLTLRENETSVSDSRQTVVVKYSGQYGGGVQDYRVGTLLKIKPRIAKEADGLVTTMQIDVRDGSIAGFQEDGSPVLNSSQITTTSDVRQGESLIIGGITVDSEYDNKSQIPGIGDIPVIGNLAKKRNKGGSRRERIVIITPRILSSAPGLINAPTLAPQPMQAIQLDPKTGKPLKKAPNAK